MHYQSTQKRICMIIDCFAALILGFLPENIHPVVALYPVAFAMSIQWCCFRGVCENPSATTFSTGNFRQLVTIILTILQRENKKICCVLDFTYLLCCLFMQVWQLFILFGLSVHINAFGLYLSRLPLLLSKNLKLLPLKILVANYQNKVPVVKMYKTTFWLLKRYLLTQMSFFIKNY